MSGFVQVKILGGGRGYRDHIIAAFNCTAPFICTNTHSRSFATSFVYKVLDTHEQHTHAELHGDSRLRNCCSWWRWRVVWKHDFLFLFVLVQFYNMGGMYGPVYWLSKGGRREPQRGREAEGSWVELLRFYFGGHFFVFFLSVLFCYQATPWWSQPSQQDTTHIRARVCARKK